MYWLFIFIPIAILLLWCFIYDRKRKSFYYGLKKDEKRNYIESELPQKEYMTTSIDTVSSDNENSHL